MKVFFTENYIQKKGTVNLLRQPHRDAKADTILPKDDCLIVFLFLL